MPKNKKENRVSLLESITSPLGFFVLSLLIVETFISMVLIFSDLPPTSKYTGMFIGAGLFVLVVIAVFLLVWFKPTHLTFSEQSHLDLLKVQSAWGASDDPGTKIETEKKSESTIPVNKLSL
ncbi:hypothetical protein KKD19_00435 [Patescibacteria group bacterium]|nr:hypothetical protein [Patescibacteria group bacterium]MCG2688763.1 hypothetical protein [Candidatus Parcubacteria bacterium]